MKLYSENPSEATCITWRVSRVLPSRRGGSASSGLTCNDGDSEPCSCEEVRPRLQASIPRWFDVLSCRDGVLR